MRLPPDAGSVPVWVPLLIASTPLGTVTAMSNSAGSRGWSLLGNHQAAISGSPTATAPSDVVTQVWIDPGPTISDGTPE